MSMSNATVAHSWAAFNFQSGTKPDASSGNLHFKAREVFSYVTLVAQALPQRRVALFTATRYSSTTDRHVSRLVGALPSDVKRLKVHSLLPFKFDESDIPQDWVKGNVIRFQRAVYDAAALILTAKRGSKQRSFDLSKAWGEYEAFCLEFDHPVEPVLVLDKVVDSAFVAACRAHLILQPSIEAAKTQAERIADWRSGKIGRSYNDKLGATLVRVHRGHVQTSLGISWPIEEAVRFWPELCGLRQLAVDHGGCHKPEGTSIKGFNVTYVTTQDITIGCHKINWSELDAVANSLGLPAFTTTQNETSNI